MSGRDDPAYIFSSLVHGDPATPILETYPGDEIMIRLLDGYGSCIIQSFGDMRNHRYHGLFGVIIIEPAGATWYKNFAFTKTVYDEEAAIVAPGIERFRECVVEQTIPQTSFYGDYFFHYFFSSPAALFSLISNSKIRTYH